MKKYFVKLLLILMALILLPTADAFCGKKKHPAKRSWSSPESRIISTAVGEKWWVHGKIRGNHDVITVVLEHRTDSQQYQRQETSVNKFGQYAFSDMGQGRPSAYKLIIYRGDRIVKQVSLKGIRKGGRVPDIKLR